MEILTILVSGLIILHLEIQEDYLELDQAQVEYLEAITFNRIIPIKVGEIYLEHFLEDPTLLIINGIVQH